MADHLHGDTEERKSEHCPDRFLGGTHGKVGEPVDSDRVLPLVGRTLDGAHVRAHMNSPLRADIMRAAQGTQGNRAVQRVVRRAAESSGRGPHAVDGDIASRLDSYTGIGGRPLEAPIRRQLEESLGVDLAPVRVHTDREAAHLARAFDALAFTTGRDVFFQEGAFDPHSPDGLRLLLHEATHVVQEQRTSGSAERKASGGPAGAISVSQEGDASEREAELVAERVMSGERAEIHASPTASVSRFRMPSAPPPPPSPEEVAKQVSNAVSTVADTAQDAAGQAATAGQNVAQDIAGLGASADDAAANAQKVGAANEPGWASDPLLWDLAGSMFAGTLGAISFGAAAGPTKTTWDAVTPVYHQGLQTLAGFGIEGADAIGDAARPLADTAAGQARGMANQVAGRAEDAATNISLLLDTVRGMGRGDGQTGQMGQGLHPAGFGPTARDPRGVDIGDLARIPASPAPPVPIPYPVLPSSINLSGTTNTAQPGIGHVPGIAETVGDTLHSVGHIARTSIERGAGLTEDVLSQGLGTGIGIARDFTGHSKTAQAAETGIQHGVDFAGDVLSDGLVAGFRPVRHLLGTGKKRARKEISSAGKAAPRTVEEGANIGRDLVTGGPAAAHHRLLRDLLGQ